MHGIRFWMFVAAIGFLILLPLAVHAQDAVEQEQENVQAEDTASARPPAVPAPPPESVLEQANKWLRRLLFRSQVDATYIGAYAQYQLTDWTEGVGSHGPVLARLSVYYLGPTEWLGENAEWLQAVYRTMDAEPTTIEYDLTIPATAKVEKVFRALYRVDHGPTHSTSLAVPDGQLDYDVADRMLPIGQEEIRLYSGTYSARKLRGSGFHGSPVVAYTSDDLPPLGIVVLGYGEQGLIYVGGGKDAEPQFAVPPPPRR
ncbi:hypothetical protein KKH27_13195 [bacterium]|nr:hypothetical protein [bacterium]MBU1983265.1 hypothetical protein [bacterium]